MGIWPERPLIAPKDPTSAALVQAAGLDSSAQEWAGNLARGRRIVDTCRQCACASTHADFSLTKALPGQSMCSDGSSAVLYRKGARTRGDSHAVLKGAVAVTHKALVRIGRCCMPAEPVAALLAQQSLRQDSDPQPCISNWRRS